MKYTTNTCKLFLIIFLFSVVINNSLANGDHPKRIIAYFASWSDQTIKGNYGVDDIPWDKLTHINYAFAGVGQDFKISFLDTATAILDTLPGQDPSLNYRGQLNLFTVYKEQFTDVKTLISVGGWAASGGFYEMTDDTNRMVTFANSCVDFIRDYGFDGVDIDFEYPSSALGCVHPLDDYLYMQYRRDVIYGHYLQLMEILRRKIDIASQEDEKQYLLTIAASASSWTLGGMKLGSYCKYIDYINIMTYDLHGTWNQYVGPQSALWASPNDPETVSLDQPTLNVDWAVKYYSGYMNPKDINIGIPYYSRGWIDVSGGNYGLWGTSPLIQHTYNYIYPGGTYTYTRDVGKGAGGLDGIWNDPPPEADAGANPIWHVMNLLQNPGTAEYVYLEGTPWGGVQTGITGYSRHFDEETKTVSVWNSNTNTFLTYEDTISLHNKLQYIADRGLGGMMFWELSGDYHLNQETGQFEGGDDMTTYSYNFFNNATLLPPVGRELPEETFDFDFTFTGAYSHPNYTPQFQIINKTNEEIPAGWIVHFDLPKSARWTSTWGTGKLSLIDDTHPYWDRYQIIGPSWQAIPAGGSVTITGAIKLSFSKGPLNVTLNGKISPYEKFLFPPHQIGEQEINLSEGYSFISSRIIPENPDMMLVLQEILNENLDFVRNSNGQVLRKIGPNWVNGIGDWITTEGYLFRMNAADEINFQGEILDPLTEIDISEGYQFVSYLPEISANALFAFENILGENLDYIRNSSGGMLRKIGPNWVNGIGNCNPGEGYLIKMFADDVLIYNIPINIVKNKITKKQLTYFTFEGGNPADPVYTIYVSGLEIGDEVAVFDNDKIVGASVINSENVFENSVPIFSTLNNGKGFEAGNTISMKVFDREKQIEVPLSFEMENPYSDAFTERYFPVEDGEYSIVNILKETNLTKYLPEESLSIYPNPANGKVNIISNEIIKDIQVLNFLGQVLLNVEVNNTQMKINTSDYQSGVYIFKINTVNSTLIKKVTIK